MVLQSRIVTLDATMHFLLLFLSAALLFAQDPFLVRPYLQLGDAPTDPTRITIVWHTAAPSNFSVTGPKGKPVPAKVQKIGATSVSQHFVYSAELSGLRPGTDFPYTVSRDGKAVFQAKGRARQSALQPSRVVIFGDSGQDNTSQREIAWQMAQAKPDWVFIVGDVVYGRGLVSEYRKNHYPIYNAEQDSKNGVSLMQQRLFAVVPGNHDTVTTDTDKFPDAQAYFLYWKQPANGPALGSQNQPKLTGKWVPTILESAGTAFPKAANYSFDNGNAHWTMLDGNGYVDWKDPALLAWLEADLAKGKKSTWRFVGFHQPGFNSSKAHFSEQQLRWLAPVFEKHGVDIVFSGHVHNYQRTFPMTFAPSGPGAKKGEVDGHWTLDKSYADQGKPKGVTYIVTGAGGAGLYNPEQEGNPATWQEFTKRFVSKTHSLSILDLKGKQLTFRQLDGTGKEIDRFQIKK